MPTCSAPSCVSRSSTDRHRVRPLRRVHADHHRCHLASISGWGRRVRADLPRAKQTPNECSSGLGWETWRNLWRPTWGGSLSCGPTAVRRPFPGPVMTRSHRDRVDLVPVTSLATTRATRALSKSGRPGHWVDGSERLMRWRPIEAWSLGRCTTSWLRSRADRTAIREDSGADAGVGSTGPRHHHDVASSTRPARLRQQAADR